MKKNSKEFKIQTKAGVYKTTIWWDKKDKSYLVKVPSLLEVVTFGTSLASAKKMAKDAIELYCDCIMAEGKVIIDDGGKAIGRLSNHSRILIPV